LARQCRRWYLVAWDPARDDWRTFRIDRVEGAPVNGAHFAPRPARGRDREPGPTIEKYF